MYGKLVMMVLGIALCGAWLLSLRQNRIQALSELTQAQLRIDQQDEKLWLLRARIAEHVTPPQIEQLCADIGPLHPILPYSAGQPAELVLQGSEGAGKAAGGASKGEPAGKAPLVKQPLRTPADKSAKGSRQVDAEKPPAERTKEIGRPRQNEKPRIGDKPAKAATSPTRVASRPPGEQPR